MRAFQKLSSNLGIFATVQQKKLERFSEPAKRYQVPVTNYCEQGKFLNTVT